MEGKIIVMQDKIISVIVPAYNEEAHIKDTVEAILSIPEVTELIVIDDASCDRTGQSAKESGAELISLPFNQGKGGALNTGLKRAKGEIIVLLDGDLGKTASYARQLMLPILAGKADMTIAKFPKPQKKGGFGLVKGLARRGIYHFTSLTVEAPLSGQRAMTREVVEYIGEFASGYGVEVGLTIDVARNGFRIQEVELPMTHAETGRDLKGFLHRGKQFIHVARILFQKAVKR